MLCREFFHENGLVHATLETVPFLGYPSDYHETKTHRNSIPNAFIGRVVFVNIQH